MTSRRTGGSRRRPPGGEEPVEAAKWAACRSYAPYSGFPVGAVLEDECGSLHMGCNIECASIGLSLCAERVALGLALARGARRFRRLWIYTPTSRPTPPCGACRELLSRFSDDLTVHLLTPGGSVERTKLSRLLPAPGGSGRKVG